MFERIFNFITSITIKDVVYCLLIAILIGALSTSVSRCQRIKAEYKNNIEALTDTIHYLHDKNGNLVATKRAFESDIKTLKLLNEDLYQEIEDLKLKNKIDNATYFAGVIENPEQDTAYIILHDTIEKGFIKDFAFKDDYSTVEGNVKYKDDSLGVHIAKNEMKFDYTVAMDEDNKVYIKSTNPYVKYNQINSFTVPKAKQKRWYAGPSVSIGYGVGLHNGKVIGTPNASIGVSVGYGLFRW